MPRVPSSNGSALHSASGVWSTHETVRLSSCWHAAAAFAAAVAFAAARPEVPRSRVRSCSQGHRSRVCVRQHTPVSGATVDKMHRPQLAAAIHCSARWNGCCTLLAEQLISSSGTGAPRAMPLAEHSVSEASLASCWLERPPHWGLSVCLLRRIASG